MFNRMLPCMLGTGLRLSRKFVPGFRLLIMLRRIYD